MTDGSGGGSPPNCAGNPITILRGGGGIPCDDIPGGMPGGGGIPAGIPGGMPGGGGIPAGIPGGMPGGGMGGGGMPVGTPTNPYRYK